MLLTYFSVVDLYQIMKLFVSWCKIFGNFTNIRYPWNQKRNIKETVYEVVVLTCQSCALNNRPYLLILDTWVWARNNIWCHFIRVSSCLNSIGGLGKSPINQSLLTLGNGNSSNTLYSFIPSKPVGRPCKAGGHCVCVVGLFPVVTDGRTLRGLDCHGYQTSSRKFLTPLKQSPVSICHQLPPISTKLLVSVLVRSLLRSCQRMACTALGVMPL